MKMTCYEEKKGFDLSSLKPLKAVAFFAFLLCFFATSNLMAATLTVGVGKTYDTITEAIAAATVGDTIDVYGTITGDGIATTGISVDKDLIIQGQGKTATIVQAAATKGGADRRVFTIPAGTTVTLKDMTIRYGNGSTAGAINNKGTLTIENCVISDNIGTGHIGAIYTSNATVVISSTEIIDNSTPGLSGGIYHIANAAASSITLTDCTISGNSAKIVGGISHVAINGGTLSATLNGCTISDNESIGTSSDGGGMRVLVDHSGSTATASLTNCTFFGNEAGNQGGALELDRMVEGATLEVDLVNCTIAGNRANSGDSSDFYNNPSPNYDAYGMGGGIFLNLYNPNVLNITNCLIADNVSGLAAPIWSDLCRDYTRIAEHASPNINNSILEVYDTVHITPNGANNLTGQQAGLNLAALADNGGPTETMALLAGSVAIDAGTDTGAPAIDQRGYDRISPSDIGAYEYAVVPAAIPTLNEWGMIILFLLTITAGFMLIRRRRVLS